VVRNAKQASARLASAAVTGTAALNAWGARAAATLRSLRVRNIFRAINEFGGKVAAAIHARVVGGARIKMR
jgi:hypothetical protein